MNVAASTPVQFLDHVLEKLPFQVESIQTDNGAEFQSPSSNRTSMEAGNGKRPSREGL